MDLFSACLAFGPVAIYLVLLGLINLSPRPTVVSGTRETMSMGLAAMGLAVVGPMQLFMPQEAAAQFGSIVWILLVGFYLLALTLAILLSAPRLVVYNVSSETVEAALTKVANRLDRDTRWAGRALVMPSLHVELVVHSFRPMHNVTLSATSHEQSHHAWQRLARALRAELSTAPVAGRASGIWLVSFGLLVLMALATRVANDPQQIARGLERMFNP